MRQTADGEDVFHMTGLSRQIGVVALGVVLACTSKAAGPAGVTDAALWLDAAQLDGLSSGVSVNTWTDMPAFTYSPVSVPRTNHAAVFRLAQ
jgi:hypothetical protein